jgi:ABC-type transport system involved in multi-copper enzyme maturation permease subunit
MEGLPLRNIFLIARYTFTENLRNRLFWILVLFGGLMIGSSILLSVLGQDQEIRMLLDMGLASTEFLLLLASVFLMVRLVLEEMESKTIYLILTRSVRKSEYLLGRFSGAIASLFVCFAVMTLLHLAVLFIKGWKPGTDGFLYMVSSLMIFEKIILISAAALFFALFSSSGVVASVFSLFLWILGHFSMEIKFLGGEITNGGAKMLAKFIYFLVPHFQYMNARDLWVTAQDRLLNFFMQGTLYTLLYSTLCLLLALIFFKKKEF